MGSPLMVFAGAGSGKTRVITYKIAHLLTEVGLKSSRILALTFTRKAADEMKHRVKELLSDNKDIKIDRAFIGTFHSWGAMVLRREAKNLGYNNDFTIYDSDDRDKLLKHIIEKQNVGNISIGSVAALISKLKQSLVLPEEFARRRVLSYKDEVFLRIYTEYEDTKKELQAMDFDDLLVRTYLLLDSNPKVAEKYSQAYDYVLVDEYQDTNKVQYLLLQKIAKREICVVGDDDQSIYSWRGADVKNIMLFKKDYPDTKVIILDKNYRSTETIVSAAYYVVGNNKQREPKTVSAVSGEGDPIVLYEGDDETDEAFFVLGKIQMLAIKKVPFRNIAVFYRTNAQSRVIEEAFVRYGIPYVLVGGLKFFERAEVKDIVSYIRFFLENDDRDMVIRMLTIPPKGIGDVKITKLEQIAQEKGLNLKGVIKAFLESCSISLDSNSTNSLKLDRETLDQINFLSPLEKIFKKLLIHKGKQLSDVVTEIIAVTEYRKYLKSKYPDNYEERIYNLDQLVEVAKNYRFMHKDLVKFLDDIILLTADEGDPVTNEKGAVSMMTLHAAKGLEFDHVFIIGVFEGMLPHARSINRVSDIEEERRLFYVGMTRAKRNLYISWSRYSIYHKSYVSPSRLISEIPDDFVDFS